MASELYEEVANLLGSGKIQPSITQVAKKELSILGEITASQKSEIIGLERWSKIYQSRHKILLQKQRECGGFYETLSSLSATEGKVDLILLESSHFVSMFLLSRDAGMVIGALYIERDISGQPPLPGATD